MSSLTFMGWQATGVFMFSYKQYKYENHRRHDASSGISGYFIHFIQTYSQAIQTEQKRTMGSPSCSILTKPLILCGW